MIQSLGSISVATPGTLVRATVNEPDPTAPYAAHGVLIQAHHDNTGKIYVGFSDMVVASFTRVLAVLPIPTVNAIPSFSASIAPAPNGVNVHDLYIDAEVATDGVIVTALRA